MSTPTVQRLADLGIELPTPPGSVGAFVQDVRSGDLMLTSGNIAVNGDKGLIAAGKVGDEIDIETAQLCARQCSLNVLAQINRALDGKLERVRRIVKLTVFIACAPTFYEQSTVANGASEVMQQAFGEQGVHVRSAIGVAALPFNSPVEVEAIVELGS